MAVAPAAACPPPLPTRTVADDVRAAPDFARRRRGWVVEELFAEAGVLILGLTPPPRPDGTGHPGLGDRAGAGVAEGYSLRT